MVERSHSRARSGPLARRGLLLAAAVGAIACAGDRAAPEESGPRREPSPSGAADDDPRLRCMRAHALDPAQAAYEGVVRALCAELHDLRGVSASVAIAREDRVVFELAVGPRCHGRDEPLKVDAPLRIGSITKLVTTALALRVADRRGTGLDEPLAAALPELSPAPTLRELMTHAAGLRDPEPQELLALGDGWPEALQRHREPAGAHAYANANFLLIGRWLERSTGRAYVELLEQEPSLAPLRALVSFAPGGTNGASEPACGHREGATWQPLELAAEPPLPAWTIPAGGGLASAGSLARLPFALEATGVLPRMLATRISSDQPGWDYGLGIRMRGEGDDLVLAHSGNTGTHGAELQWSPKHRVSVAVLSSTPQAFKATLHAAWVAGMAEAGPD